jgi:hypothetical protein
MSKLRIIIFISFAPAFFLLGCTHTLNINVTEIDNYPQPLIEPLPINVGVYYGDDFRTYKTTQINGYPEEFTRICNIRLGKANISLFDTIMHSVFENVTSLQHFPNELVNLKNIDLILEPKISDYTYIAVELAWPEATIYITYEIKFYLPDGKQISTWTISGKSYLPPRSETGVIVHGKRSIIKLTKLAMREVAAQFFTGFCDQDQIDKLYYIQCKQ